MVANSQSEYHAVDHNPISLMSTSTSELYASTEYYLLVFGLYHGPEKLQLLF